MPKFLQNTLGILLCWGVVLGAGVYVTYMQQPEELQRLKDAEKVERMKRAEVTTLLQEEAASVEQAKEAVQQWNTQYKQVPDTMTTAAVVSRINDLTRDGFENFDIAFRGVTRTPEFNYLTYDIRGRGYFSKLYAFVREIENRRDFYRLSDLRLEHIDLIKADRETGAERMQVMVSFTMNLEAYFGGAATMQAPKAKLVRLIDQQEGMPLHHAQGLVEVPKEVLPDEQLAINPFFPGILEQLPPNTNGLIDVEEAELISIVDNEAVFKDETGYRSVGVGDPVYLGQIIEVDPRRNSVVARLNKGGIIDEVNKLLDTGEPYRHAQGPRQLAPTNP